eukprot:c37152_g1_i1 orf=153-329(+)
MPTCISILYTLLSQLCIASGSASSLPKRNKDPKMSYALTANTGMLKITEITHNDVKVR